MTTEVQDKKLDIFTVLENADLKNYGFYSDLEPELQKQFSPLVVMRWLSSASDSSPYCDYMLQMTNEFINVDFWSLQKHPEMQWKLMALCGAGKKLRHNWIPMVKRRKLSKVGEFMAQWFPSANDMEIELLIKRTSRDEFEQFVKDAGYSDEALRNTLIEFDLSRGIETKEKKSKPKATKTTKASKASKD